MYRISVSVSEEQHRDLTRIAAMDQSSVANVVRDCIRAIVPQLLAVTEFIHDPRNSSVEVLAFADQMERTLGLLAGASLGVAGVTEGDGATPPARRRKPASPPSSNTGAQS